jgi:hypothetical protein
MSERATAWRPVPDINEGFGSISFSYDANDSRCAHVLMNGTRKLSLKFTRVIAFQFEDECPGNFKLPPAVPKLRENLVFPLLKIDNSEWINQWPMWSNLTHYMLLSSDDLVRLIALPEVDAHWL